MIVKTARSLIFGIAAAVCPHLAVGVDLPLPRSLLPLELTEFGFVVVTT